MKEREWTFKEFEEITGVKRKVLERLRGDNGPLAQSETAWIKKEYNEQGIKVIKEDQLFKISLYIFVMNLCKNRKENEPRSLKSLVDEFKNYIDNNELVIGILLSHELEEYQKKLSRIIKAYKENNTDFILEIIKELKK